MGKSAKNGSNGIPKTLSRVIMTGKGDKFEEGNISDFGERVILFPRQYRPFRTEEFLSTLRGRLSEIKYDPDTDYIAVTGNILVVTLVCTYLGLHYDNVKLLLWDRNMGEYQDRELQAEDVEEVEKLG